MADPASEPVAAKDASPKEASSKNAPKTQNRALRMLGIPNWKPKLPSRNWLIFYTVVGSWTGAYFYDRYQRKRAQQKWTTLVSHVAHQKLDTYTLPRRITIYLAAPPGDGLRCAREHFVEYIKPILVAGGVDWEVVEGRREGEVRAGLAERIRRLRKMNGEPSDTPIDTEDVKFRLESLRQRVGIREAPELQGDLVIGRHTWKEYVRGLHEGWLGSMNAPPPLPEAQSPDAKDANTPAPANPSPSTTSDTPGPSTDTQSSSDPSSLVDIHSSPQTSPLTDSTLSTDVSRDQSNAEAGQEKKGEEAEKPKGPPPIRVAHNHPTDYPTSTLPSHIPRAFQPISVVQFPHLLGFLNTPIRMWRFLNKRYVADDTGRQTAALVLSQYRPWHEGQFRTQGAFGEELGRDLQTEESPRFPSDRDAASKGEDEIRTALMFEERNWKKKFLSQPDASQQTEDSTVEEGPVHEATSDDQAPKKTKSEYIWSDAIVLDPRIAGRMRRFEVDKWDEERALRISHGASSIPGRPDLKAGEANAESTDAWDSR